MISLESIKTLCNQIVEKFNPEKVILFGSYAYGTPTEDSDVDLLVIMPFEGRAIYKAVEISTNIDHPFAMDLLVRRPEEVAWRYEGYDPLIRAALDHGRILYEQQKTTAEAT